MPVGLPAATAQSFLCSVNKEGEAGIRPPHASLLFSYAIPFGVDAREKHAPKSYPIQKCEVVSQTPDRNSNGATFTPCGRRIGHGCFSFLVARDCLCPGISVVRVAGKLSLLLRQWTASGIGGCALNPRLLFPNKPRDSRPGTISRSKTY